MGRMSAADPADAAGAIGSAAPPSRSALRCAGAPAASTGAGSDQREPSGRCCQADAGAADGIGRSIGYGAGDHRLPTLAPASTPGIVIGCGSPGRTLNGV